ncbi:HAD family hydrolase [Rarobacter faecitabidus]|uniref:Phosphoglycolate phosphatase n=1 Tax=Rarobacter faecitabidus TaxID=13243 RepID=A0A542ZXU9_RARFA|nr:HAD hydrolase-like protein [Rarobacter faecitabidus]TQL65040.1 phosphoglycolate phosphatase [Rarobacter faecitabidus]
MPGNPIDSTLAAGISAQRVTASEGALVLIDLDGTLVDSGDGILASLRVAFDEAGVPRPGEAELRRFLGPPIYYSLDALGITGEPADRVVAAYRQHYHDVGMHQSAAFAGIPAALDRMRTELESSATGSVRLVVATSKPETYAKRIVQLSGLAPHLDAVYGASLDGTRTSKADVIAHALHGEAAYHGEAVYHSEAAYQADTADTVPDRRIMIGDRKFDVLGAAAHGIATIGVLWGYGDAEELVGAGAVLIAHSPAELPTLVVAAALTSPTA